MRRIGGELSTIATLNVPNGNVWRVGLKKADNKFWFFDGWQEFVQRYSIGVGYFLVFRYEGNSSFNVNIFHLATSEINYELATRSSNEGPYFTNQHHIFNDMEDEDSTEYLALQNNAFSGSVDQLTPGKNYASPPSLQNLFNGSKLNSVNWGDSGGSLSSKGANPQKNQFTKDIGVQFNAAEFKRSTEELKLHHSGDDMQRVKKTVRKKRKTDPGNLL